MRPGRSKRTVSTVLVTPHLTCVKCAARAMSVPRSQMWRLSSSSISRCLLKVRTRNHVEDGLTIGRDLPRHGPEGMHPSADTAVDRNSAARVEASKALRAEDESQTQEPATHASKAIDPLSGDQPSGERNSAWQHPMFGDDAVASPAPAFGNDA